MPPSQRPGHMDVSNTIDVSQPEGVRVAVRDILTRCYGDLDQFAVIDQMFEDFARLYEGDYPGYHGCDISYHNMQHVLDVTLAMARLIDGYEQTRDEEPTLGPCRALAGVCCALFHDSGYIRKRRDTRHDNGAAYTRVHVSRSARFLAEYLPTVGLTSLTGLCAVLVHFTGYERNPDTIKVPSKADRTLGALLGTADLIAQMADAQYPEKCRDHLYEEFRAGGIAGEGSAPDQVRFHSPQHLLESTPQFMRTAVHERLEGFFDHAYRYAAVHFGGDNLYMDAVCANCLRLEAMLAENPATAEYAGGDARHG